MNRLGEKINNWLAKVTGVGFDSLESRVRHTVKYAVRPKYAALTDAMLQAGDGRRIVVTVQERPGINRTLFNLDDIQEAVAGLETGTHFIVDVLDREGHTVQTFGATKKKPK